MCTYVCMCVYACTWVHVCIWVYMSVCKPKVDIGLLPQLFLTLYMRQCLSLEPRAHQYWLASFPRDLVPA